MKPLAHPAIETVPVESILHALADPVRVALLARIIAQDCASNCTTLLEALDAPIPKSTLSQHMRILREAGLIRSERHGVEMRNTARCAEVNGRYPGLLQAILTAHRTCVQSRKKTTRRTRA